MSKKSQHHERKPIAVDCFAGCGGMTRGLKLAGYRVAGAIEIDADACRAYEENHPEVHIWKKDIKRVTAPQILRELRLKKGSLGLLGGCPPCQGFSTLRTYNGRHKNRDKRNDLLFEFQRLVRGLRPKRVMLENVPGLATDRRLAKFKAALKTMGYEIASDVLDVADFGVPQRRKRLVLLASRVSDVRFAERARTRRTVRSALKGLGRAGSSGDPLHDLPENRKPEVIERIRAIPKNGGSRNALPKRLQLACHEGPRGFSDVYGRMAWDHPAPTITTGCFNPSKGRFLHPTANRAITMREAALLQSFPRGYKFPPEMGKVKIATMIGNALPPEFIRRHAQALRQSGRVHGSRYLPIRVKRRRS